MVGLSACYGDVIFFLIQLGCPSTPSILVTSGISDPERFDSKPPAVPLCVSPSPPGLLSSWSTLLGVFPSHLTDLRDEVNYSVPQSSAKSKLKSQSSSASLEHTASTQGLHVQEWRICSGCPKSFSSLRPIGQWFRSCEVFRFLFFNRSVKLFTHWIVHAGLGPLAFARTTKIHCACWDLRPHPWQASISVQCPSPSEWLWHPTLEGQVRGIRL